MLSNAQFQQVEDESVDTLTGEIIEVADAGNIVVDDLPKICRALRAVRRRQQMIAEYLADETERLTGACSAKSAPLAHCEQKLMSIAQELLDTTGERRLEYPGLGVVRWVAGRESVNTEKWDAMDTHEKIAMQNVNQVAIRVVMTIKPDKGAIMKQLKDGLTSTIPLADAFSINPAVDRFEFQGGV